jgi:hypothetical protein
MKDEKELNADILQVIMKIKETYPELSKYINEIPVSTSNADFSETNHKNLKDYYDSLYSLLTTQETRSKIEDQK